MLFSCLPYTASEIENATHHEELPPARRTVLCVYGAVRGVGGIDLSLIHIFVQFMICHFWLIFYILTIIKLWDKTRTKNRYLWKEKFSWKKKHT